MDVWGREPRQGGGFLGPECRKPAGCRRSGTAIVLVTALYGINHGRMIEAIKHTEVLRTCDPLRCFCAWMLAAVVVGLNLFVELKLPAAETTTDKRPTEALVPLKLKLPAPAFVGTPQNIAVGSDVEPMSKQPRPPLMVPNDVKNLAPGSQITCSDTNAVSSTLAKITDGDKQAIDTSVVLLRKGSQYVQFDLGSPDELFAIVIWHAHDSPKVYHDVIVQVADDAGFTQNVRTLFNNDRDNSSGRGIGTDREYFDTNEGKLVDPKGTLARHVRVYSRGSTESALNEYTEVEIYGRPPK